MYNKDRDNKADKTVYSRLFAGRMASSDVHPRLSSRLVAKVVSCRANNVHHYP